MSNSDITKLEDTLTDEMWVWLVKLGGTTPDDKGIPELVAKELELLGLAECEDFAAGLPDALGQSNWGWSLTEDGEDLLEHVRELKAGLSEPQRRTLVSISGTTPHGCTTYYHPSAAEALRRRNLVRRTGCFDATSGRRRIAVTPKGRAVLRVGDKE